MFVWPSPLTLLLYHPTLFFKQKKSIGITILIWRGKICFKWGHISHQWNKTVQLLQILEWSWPTWNIWKNYQNCARSHEIYRMFTFCLCRATTSFNPPKQFRKQNIAAKRKQGKAALWPSHRKTESLGQGEKGKIQFSAPLLPNLAAWTTTSSYCQPAVHWLHKAKLCAAWLHPFFFLSCSLGFHTHKWAGNSHTQEEWNNTLSSKMWSNHTESKTPLTHGSATPHTTHTAKTLEEVWYIAIAWQLSGGELSPRTQAGKGLGRTRCAQWALSPRRTGLEFLPKVVFLHLTRPPASVSAWS